MKSDVFEIFTWLTTILFIQALRDQWDKLIALASKNGVYLNSSSSSFLVTRSYFQVDLGLLYKQVTECGMSCIDESRCRYAMLFYRCLILHATLFFVLSLSLTHDRQFLCLNRAMCSFKNWSDQAPDRLRQAIMK